jgi:hypothetical protein
MDQLVSRVGELTDLEDLRAIGDAVHARMRAIRNAPRPAPIAAAVETPPPIAAAPPAEVPAETPPPNDSFRPDARRSGGGRAGRKRK